MNQPLTLPKLRNCISQFLQILLNLAILALLLMKAKTKSYLCQLIQNLLHILMDALDYIFGRRFLEEGIDLASVVCVNWILAALALLGDAAAGQVIVLPLEAQDPFGVPVNTALLGHFVPGMEF